MGVMQCILTMAELQRVLVLIVGEPTDLKVPNRKMWKHTHVLVVRISTINFWVVWCKHSLQCFKLRYPDYINSEKDYLSKDLVILSIEIYLINTSPNDGKFFLYEFYIFCL